MDRPAVSVSIFHLDRRVLCRVRPPPSASGSLEYGDTRRFQVRMFRSGLWIRLILFFLFSIHPMPDHLGPMGGLGGFSIWDRIMGWGCISVGRAGVPLRFIGKNKMLEVVEAGLPTFSPTQHFVISNSKFRNIHQETCGAIVGLRASATYRSV